MPKRRSDAHFRRFFDEFTKLRISRLRATGVVDPTKRFALIPIGDKQKLIGTNQPYSPPLVAMIHDNASTPLS